MLSKIFGVAVESGNEGSGETTLRPDELEKIGAEGNPIRDHMPVRGGKIWVLLAIIFSLLATCIGCQKAIGEQAIGEPKGGHNAEVEARAGGEGRAMARAGDGAVARAGGAKARAGDAVAKAEGRAESHIESSGDGERVREASLEFQGNPETAFSGTCNIGDEEREVSGQVPERFVFELDGQKLECEIHKQSTGTMNVILDAGGTDYVQRTDSRRTTIRIVYSGQGYSSSIQSSIGSSRQSINAGSSSIVSASSKSYR